MMKMSEKSRRWAIAGLVALLAAVVAIGVATTGGDDEPPVADDMAGMEGMRMGGMEMDVSTAGSVRLTGDQIRRFGVTFGTAEPRVLESTVRAVGIVGLDETRVVEVAPKFGGYVERLYVDFTGQQVRRGQPLVEIYSPELVTAQEELLLSRRLDESLGESSVPGIGGRGARLAELSLRRLRLWDISDAQIDEILRTGRVSRTMTLHAPVSGTVIEKPVLRGQAIRPGETLYTIADLSEVWIEAELREQDAATVREGSTAVVELHGFEGGPLTGEVEYIYPTVASESRTLKARIAVPNPAGRIRPGMYANVRISTPSRRALTVPAAAVVHTGARAVVFVDMGGGALMPHEVQVGRVAGDLTEIVSGLQAGQRVVTSAQYILESESSMAEVMRSMIGMTGEAMEMDGMEMDGVAADPAGAEGMEMDGMPMPAGR